MSVFVIVRYKSVTSNLWVEGIDETNSCIMIINDGGDLLNNIPMKSCKLCHMSASYAAPI